MDNHERLRVKIIEIDEFLAEKIIEGKSTFRLSLECEEDSGVLQVKHMGFEDTEFGEGMDFELSTSECRGPEEADLHLFSGKTLYTSSAYEFLEYYFSHESSLNCYVKFENNSWVIKLD